MYHFTGKETAKYLLEGAAVCAAADYLFYQSLPVLLFMLPIPVLFLKMQRKKCTARQQRELNYQFRDALTAMNVAVQAGYSAEFAVRVSVLVVGFFYDLGCDILDVFRYIDSLLRLSVPVEELFLDLGKRSGVEDIENFAAVFYTAKRTGGDMTQVIQKVARMLSDKIEVKKEIEATLAAKKSEQMVMSIMPAGIICYLKLTSPGFLDVLYGNPFGICAMTVCMVIYGLSYWLGVKIVDIEVYVRLMWIHILFIMGYLGVFLAGKMGRLPPEAGNPEEKKLFIRIALTGNIIGMLLTFQSGGDKVYSSGYRMEKEETGAYEEKFKVSVDGEEAGSLYVQVPEKETEGSEEEPETELSEEQQREKELQDMIVQYNQKKNDPQYYYLPDEWNGKHLEWEQPKDKTGNLLSALGLSAAVAAVIAKKREEQNAQIKRREQMLMDYPGLIMKFTLLVQAGLTARKAFQKIALDYGKREDGKKREAYEEIRVACYEMDSGISEAEAYRRFGERCGQVKYKTLSTLLIQNLQKGSRKLADLLEKESVEAWEERKRKARVLGDTAATKLLLPMVLMLLVVMAVIMLPACLSFYGG